MTQANLPVGVMTKKVIARNFIRGSLVAYVIKSGKARTIDITHAVIGYKKMFLPPHIHVILVGWIIYKIVSVEYLNVRME